MKNQKLKLEDIELNSFSTMEANDTNTVKGGQQLWTYPMTGCIIALSLSGCQDH